MDTLDRLEARSIYILREAYREFKSLCMLWSIGKDSTVLLWLARRAFFGHVPFPLVHIDTHFKIPEMIEYRDRMAREWKLNMVYGENTAALISKETFPDGKADRITCCRNLKSEALKRTLSGEWTRYRMDHALGRYVTDPNKEPYTGVIVGARLGLAEHREQNARVFGLQLDAEDVAAIEVVQKQSRDLFKTIGDCGDEYRG